MNISQIIDEITTTHCVNCKFGKCLIALKPLREAEQPDSNGNNASHAVTQRKLQKKTAVSKANGKTKECNACGKTLPIAGFPKNKTCKGGYAGTCKDCCYARVKRHNAQKRASQNKSAADPEPRQPAGIIRCKLCDYRAIDEARLHSHMKTNHGCSSI